VELPVSIIIFIILLALFCEYIDSTLGMGYGTTLTPVLLIVGFAPLQIVPVVLFSELISGILAAVFHHREGNVNLKPKVMNISLIISKLKTVGYREGYRRGVPTHLRIAILLALCSIIGTLFAVFVAVNIPSFWLKLYIGILVFAMGVIILVCRNKAFRLSWRKITALGLIASFNKGMSGGGYGPVVTSGQILSGVEGKSAVGITSLAEGLTCLVGIIAYIFIVKNPIDLTLAPYIIIGAVLSVPLSAKSVRVISDRKLTLGIAVLTLGLGAYTIFNTLKICFE
jgi:hypothetical protein